MTLSYKHQAFVDNFFLCNRNATDAYCATYDVDRPTGRANGAKLLANANIAEAIKKRTSEKAMGADEVLQRLASMARGDIGELMDIESMSFEINLAQAKAKGLTHLIKKVKQITKTTAKDDGDEETNIQEIELYSSLEALQTLAKIHGLMVDRTDITSAGEPIRIVEVAVPPEPNDSGG
jgi:phage terminase small subunit